MWLLSKLWLPSKRRKLMKMSFSFSFKKRINARMLSFSFRVPIC
jgi:hypothetical protein